MIRRLFLVLFLLALGFAAGFFVKPQVKVVVFNQQEYDKLVASLAKREEAQLKRIDMKIENNASRAMKPVLKVGSYWVYFNPENEDFAVLNAADNNQPVALRLTEEGLINMSFYGMGASEDISFTYKEKTGELEMASVSFTGEGGLYGPLKSAYIDGNGDGVLDKWIDIQNRLDYELDGLTWVKRKEKENGSAESE